MGSCLTPRNEPSEETHVLTKQETLLERGARAEGGRAREPRGAALPQGSQPRVLQWAMGLVSGLSLANDSDSGSFLCYTHCSAKMDCSKEDSGRW